MYCSSAPPISQRSPQLRVALRRGVEEMGVRILDSGAEAERRLGPQQWRRRSHLIGAPVGDVEVSAGGCTACRCCDLEEEPAAANGSKTLGGGDRCQESGLRRYSGEEAGAAVVAEAAAGVVGHPSCGNDGAEAFR
jgi:hypothetical protein